MWQKKRRKKASVENKIGMDDISNQFMKLKGLGEMLTVLFNSIPETG